MACFCCRRINTTTSLVVLFHLPRAERFVRHALLAEPAFLDLHWRKEMVNSTFPRPIGIDSSLCLLSQHTWRRILPRRCHLDRRRGGCCPATATGANPHHVRRRPERLNCCRPSPFSVACPVLPFVSLTLRYTRLFVQLSPAESRKSINQVRAVPFQDKSKVTSIFY